MNPKLKLAELRFAKFWLMTFRWIVSAIVVELLSIFLISPVVLLYLCVLNTLGKTCIFFQNTFMLWLASSVIVFVPMFLSVIIKTISDSKKQKKETKTI